MTSSLIAGEVEVTGDTAQVWSNKPGETGDITVVTPSNSLTNTETATDINQFLHLTDYLTLHQIHNLTTSGFNLIDLYKEALNKRT